MDTGELKYGYLFDRLFEPKEEKMPLTEERIIEVLEKGCPKCGRKDRLAVDSTELTRRAIELSELPDGKKAVEWYTGDFIDTVSNDYILCRACFWQEPEE